MTDSMETTSPGRTTGGKIRTLAIGALATAALSIPALSAVGVVAHSASGRSEPAVRSGRVSQDPVISPDSHRLALTMKPASVRLT